MLLSMVTAAWLGLGSNPEAGGAPMVPGCVYAMMPFRPPQVVATNVFETTVTFFSRAGPGEPKQNAVFPQLFPCVSRVCLG